MVTGSETQTGGREGKFREVIKDELTNVKRLSDSQGRRENGLSPHGGGVDGNNPAAVPISAIHHNLNIDSNGAPGNGVGGSIHAGGDSNGNSLAAGKHTPGLTGQSADGNHLNTGGTLNGGKRTGTGNLDVNGKAGGSLNRNIANGGKHRGTVNADGTFGSGDPSQSQNGINHRNDGSIDAPARSGSSRGGSPTGNSPSGGSQGSGDTGTFSGGPLYIPAKENFENSDNPALKNSQETKGALNLNLRANSPNRGSHGSGGSSVGGNVESINNPALAIGQPRGSIGGSADSLRGESLAVKPLSSTSYSSGSPAVATSDKASTNPSAGSQSTSLNNPGINSGGSPAVGTSSNTATNPSAGSHSTSSSNQGINSRGSQAVGTSGNAAANPLSGNLSTSSKNSGSAKSSRNNGQSNSLSAKPGLTTNAVNNSAFKSSDNSQCSDTCCDEYRPQILLSRTTPGSSCCDRYGKVVIPIDLEKLTKIAMSEIIEITAEKNNVAMLKKLLKLAEKYEL